MSLGLVVLALPELARGSTPDLLAQTVATTAAAACLFAIAGRTPDVDTRLTTRRAMFALSVAVAAAVGVAVPLDALRIQRFGSAIVAVAVAYVAYTSRGRRNLSWLVAVLVATGLAAATAAALPTAMLGASGAPILHFAAGVAAILGTSGALQSATRSHRAAAFEAARERDRSDARAHAVEVEHAATLHEVRTTVLTLEGGVRSLRPTSPAPDLALADALLAELARLRGLVEPSHPDESSFAIHQALEPLLMLCATAGQTLHWDIAPDLQVIGRAHDVAEIVNELLINARHHAPTSAVEISAAVDDGFVLIKVEDRGPGVPRGHRDLIFAEGARAGAEPSPEHQGLGLHIARRLARDLGGDLWVEQRRPWGARFVLALPAAPDVASCGVAENRSRSCS
jgi:signal transduction histidine kinase